MIRRLALAAGALAALGTWVVVDYVHLRCGWTELPPICSPYPTRGGEAFIEGQFTPEGARRAKILIDGLFYEGESIVWALDDGRMLARTAFLHEQHRNIGRVYNWLNPAVQGHLLASPLQIGAPPCAELDDVLVPLNEDRRRLWWRATPFSIYRFLLAPRERELRAWRNSACG